MFYSKLEIGTINRFIIFNKHSMIAKYLKNEHKIDDVCMWHSSSSIYTPIY